MRFLLLGSVLCFGATSLGSPFAAANAQDGGKAGGDRTSEEAGRRVQELLDEKESRTPAQRKIDSQLLYALRRKRGKRRGVPTGRIDLKTDAKGRVLVDVAARVSARLFSKIRRLGGEVVSASERYHTARAWLALEKLEGLAASDDVRFIAPAAPAATHGGAKTN